MAQIYGELIQAQLHLSASDLTNTATGLVYYNTASNAVKWFTGSVWKTAADLDSSQSLSNKTLGSTNTLTGATAASFTNTGTVTLFTATDTVVGRSTTDTLSNKTLDSALATTSLTLNAQAELRLADSDSSNYVGFKSPGTVSSNKVWVLPSTDSTGTQALVSNGSLVLSWSSFLSDPLTTRGDLLVRNASNINDRLAVGSANTVLCSDGTDPSWRTIVNADVSASAAIAYSKLATLTAGNIVLGNGSNVATSTAVTGDVTIDSSGVTAIGTGVIVNADINASAAISGSKIQAASDTNTGTISYYKEGTFTPTWTTSGVNFSSVTYTTQSGKYTRVGNLVSFTLRVDVSSVTVGSASGALTVGGLPHSSGASVETIVHVKSNVVDYNGSPTGGAFGTIASGASTINIGANTDNGSYVDALATANGGATARFLIISGSYLV